MFKKENVVRAEFCRNGYIDVYLAGETQPVSLFRGSIEESSKKLSEREIKAVINILTSEKRSMVEQCNFPPSYERMLSDLIKAQRNRYGKYVKKDKIRRLGYSVGRGKLEEILGEYFKIKDVHIYSIDVGNDRSNAERIDLESDDSYLVLSFREEIEDAI